MPARLPLFPLNVPVVPGLVLPLHIFEPRYRQLVNDLMAIPDEDRREFGIVGIREGRTVEREGMTALFPIGVAAVLRQVDPHDDGRFDIVTTGTRRFRLLELDDSAPLLVGQVEFLEDPVAPADDVLARTVARAFLAYRIVLGGQVPDDGDGEDATEQELPDDPTVLAYLVTAAMVLPATERQELLAADTVTERLQRAARLLRRECAMISSLSAMPSLEPLGPVPSPN